MTPGTDWIDQAQRLVDVLRGGLAGGAPSADAGPSPDGASAGGAPDGDRHSADCRWCPICQVASVLRGERPEVTAALADVLTTAATALRTIAAAGEPSGATTEADPAPQESAPPPPVQRIDIA
jgi:hypothetical protein